MKTTKVLTVFKKISRMYLHECNLLEKHVLQWIRVN